MKRFEAQEAYLPAALLSRYASAVKRFNAREDRFSARVLLGFTAVGQEGFEVRAGEGEASTEILLYDEIGYWGVTAKDFVLALAAAGPGPIKLRINSPGGDVFDGLAIYNALRARSSPVTVVIDGIAASAASFIAMAGQTVEMPEHAMLMIHRSWAFCMGNCEDMLNMAALQAKIDGMMADIYAKKCGKPVADLSAAMNAETYYTSTEAKALGLCDTILLPADAAPAALSVPKNLLSRLVAARKTVPRADALPPYDPDGDGDNDAAEALTLIGAAMSLLEEASEALTGVDDDAAETGESESAAPIVPGAAAAAAEASAEDKTHTAAIAARRLRLRLAEAEAA